MTLFEQILINAMPMVGTTIVLAVLIPAIIVISCIIWQKIDQRQINKEIKRCLNEEG